MRTNTQKCVGCNKCISVCPVYANDAKLEKGRNVIHAQPKLCINCGYCVDKCDTKARWNQDDSEAFLLALKMGEPFSLLVAPSVRMNIPEYRRLLGYLKQQGVQLIYDVSFGADISSWGYVRALEAGKGPLIAQPCPVVVRYIEKFLPQLLPRLAPVHSPAMCTAIYMSHVMGINTYYAFLSPCIAKKMEFEDGETGDFVQFSVTYSGLMKQLEKNGVDLSKAPEADFDSPPGGFGFTLPRPGGLTENLRSYMGDDIWVRQMEGMNEIKVYLHQYAQRLEKGLPVPLVVDLLSCKQGCNNGSATEKKLHLDDIDFETNRRKKELDSQKTKELFRSFDEKLNVDAFSRGYTIRSDEQPVLSDEMLENAFISLGKITEEERSRNCYSCGYGSCWKFARAVALGQNHISNCVTYMRHRLDEQAEELLEKNESILDSLRYASKIQRSLLPSEQDMMFAFPEYRLRWIPKDIVGGDLYWLKTFYDGTLLCVGDCTGHGTPGALLTMLVISALDAVVTEKSHSDVAGVMRAMDAQLSRALATQQKASDSGWNASTQISDGVDLALIFLKSNGGASFLLVGGVRVITCKEGEVTRYKGQRLHLGDGSLCEDDVIKVHTLEQDDGYLYFVLSDGFSDQIGEKNGLPFGLRRTEKLLKESGTQPLGPLFEAVENAFDEHKGNEEQRDDVTLLAFRR